MMLVLSLLTWYVTPGGSQGVSGDLLLEEADRSCRHVSREITSSGLLLLRLRQSARWTSTQSTLISSD